MFLSLFIFSTSTLSTNILIKLGSSFCRLTFEASVFLTSVIFLFNMIAALLFPTLGTLLGFSTKSGEAFGIFAGTAINDTSSVTAAASTWDSMWNLGSETLNKAVEKGYLTKGNVKNFVCFGSTASPCPTENLYRIIGVFGNNVKLIKWDYAKSSLLGTDGDFSQEYSYYFSGEQGENPSSNSLYYWNNSTQKNTWSESNLNKVNLNTNFINNIGTEWANKIADTAWKVGGNTWANIGTSPMNTAYQNEIVNPVTTNTIDNKTEYTAKIGLMYVSDYGYAADPSSWTLAGYNSDYTKSYASARGENWLYGGGWDWTISRYADHSGAAFMVHGDGGVYGRHVGSFNHGCRPSFNLESSITYVSGSGTAADPITIN